MKILKNAFSKLIHGQMSNIVWGISGQKYMAIQLVKCSHCYHKSNRDEGTLSFKKWIEVLDQYQALIDKLYLRPFIIFCGGGPLTNPFLISLIKECSGRWNNLKMAIITNGTILRDQDILQIGSCFKW